MGLGRFMRSVRESRNLTMEEVSKGICTKKYIYLIEKDKRIPSVSILKMLGKKMEIDFFEYLAYIDCFDPIKVRNVLSEFTKLRKMNAYDQLEKLNNEIKMDMDFITEPWKYEVEYNTVMIYLLKYNNYRKALTLIYSVFEKGSISKEFSEHDLKNVSGSLIQFYNLLGIYWKHMGEYQKSISLFQKMYNFLISKRNLIEYRDIYINVTLNLMQVYFMTFEYVSINELSKELLEFQIKNVIIDRLSVNYAIQAASYYKLGEKTKAIQMFQKSMYLCIAFEQRMLIESILKEINSLNLVKSEVYDVNLKKESRKLLNHSS